MLLTPALNTLLMRFQLAVVLVLSGPVSLDVCQLFVLEGGDGSPCEFLLVDLHASKGLLWDGGCFAFGRRASHMIPFQLGFGLVL